MLTGRQKKCLELMVSGELTQYEIAEKIKVSVQTICNWKKNEEFIAEYESMMRQGIQALAAKAFHTHAKLLGAKSEMVRYMTAKDILDRAGFAPEEKINLGGDIGLELTIDYGKDES